MADAGGDAGLPPQALAFLFVGALPHALDRHGAIQPLVVRGVHDAHSAFTELSPDAVSRQRAHDRILAVNAGAGERSA